MAIVARSAVEADALAWSVKGGGRGMDGAGAAGGTPRPGAGATTGAFADLTLAARVAALLGATLSEAPFRHAGAAVPRLALRNRRLDLPVRLDLWPALARVDVALGDCFFVFTGVDEVVLLPGIEVLFRRTSPRGFLFVTVDGAVSSKT